MLIVIGGILVEEPLTGLLLLLEDHAENEVRRQSLQRPYQIDEHFAVVDDQVRDFVLDFSGM